MSHWPTWLKIVLGLAALVGAALAFIFLGWLGFVLAALFLAFDTFHLRSRLTGRLPVLARVPPPALALSVALGGLALWVWVFLAIANTAPKPQQAALPTPAAVAQQASPVAPTAPPTVAQQAPATAAPAAVTSPTPAPAAKPAEAPKPTAVPTPVVSEEAKAAAVARLGSATSYAAKGELGLALEEARQAVALWPAYPEGAAFLTQTAPKATATAQAVAAAEAAAAKEASDKAQRWASFQNYGPQLVDLLKRSDEINRTHAQAVGLFPSGITLTQLYTLTDRAAAGHGTLATQVAGVTAPAEARELKNSISGALRTREDAMNKLKAALNGPTVANQAAYEEAKKKADISALAPVGRVFELCGDMAVPLDDCLTVVGLKS